ncbi:hypothetical protein BCR43DRAFT_486404 [Syncephalastrum racemosum]|uniref:F-box domain-containing protein n=1 Tax=Syncephalastrum racemosum TaxID=13706 RepID=A0A1X2HP83_SYNRA|nr:hypothetical protein BCR43DRAFT_486404 [Syncephalastrum racemosum]
MREVPIEILQLISQHVPLEDRYACLGVSRLWHAAFATSAIEAIELYGYEALQQLLTQFDAWKCGSAPVPLLMHVSRMRVFLPQTNWQSVSDLKLLIRLCTRLQDLEVDLRCHTSPDDKIADSMWPFATALFPCMMTHLARLRLDMVMIDRTAVKNSILPQLPELTDLHLDLIEPCWMINDMECIHALCPKIESIHIATSAFIDPLANPAMDEQHPPAEARHLRSFHFTATYGLEFRFLSWIHYATYRYYESLEHFSLDGSTLDHRFFWLDENDQPVQQNIRDLHFNDFEAINAMNYRLTASLFREFRMACKKLSSFGISHLTLSEALFRDKLVVPGLRHLGLDLCSNPHLLGNYSLRLVDRSITSLQLRCSPSLFSHISYILHRGVPNLTYLEMICKTQVELDTILSACPHLHTLTLQSGCPVTWESVWWRPHPALQRLIIQNCSFKEVVIGYISRQCAELKELFLDRCTIMLSEAKIRSSWLQLDLTGFRCLSILHVHNPILWCYETSSSGWDGVCDFIGLDNYPDSQGAILWYNTEHHPHVPSEYIRPSEHVLGQRPLRDEASACIVNDVLSRKPENRGISYYLVLLLTCRRNSNVVYYIDGRRLLLR